MSNEERQNQTKDYSYLDSALKKLNKINKNSNIAFYFSAFYAFANIWAAIVSVSISGIIVGLTQVFLSFLLAGIAYWSWTKATIPKYLLVIFYLYQLFQTKFSSVPTLFSFVGLVLTVITITDLREYKKLEKLEGFPHFNERFVKHQSEYIPTHKISSKNNNGNMDFAGTFYDNIQTDTQQTTTQAENKTYEIVLDALPQVDDMYSVEKPDIGDNQIPDLKTEINSILEKAKKYTEPNTSETDNTFETYKKDLGQITEYNHNSISLEKELRETPVTNKTSAPVEITLDTVHSNKSESDTENIFESLRPGYSDYFSQYETIFDNKNKIL